MRESAFFSSSTHRGPPNVHPPLVALGNELVLAGVLNSVVTFKRIRSNISCKWLGSLYGFLVPSRGSLSVPSSRGRSHGRRVAPILSHVFSNVVDLPEERTIVKLACDSGESEKSKRTSGPRRTVDAPEGLFCVRIHGTASDVVKPDGYVCQLQSRPRPSSAVDEWRRCFGSNSKTFPSVKPVASP